MTIYEKLTAIQVAFKAKKSRYNSFGKYNFRSAEDILEAVKPHLKEHGCSILIDEKIIEIAPVPMLLSTASISDGGAALTASAVVGVDLNQKGMQTPQQFGSASSYGKKYALGNLLLIDDTQDSDASNTHGKAAKAKPKISSTKDAAFAKAKSYISDGGTLDAIKKKYELSTEVEEALTL